MDKIAYVGIDYHLNSLSIAVVIEGHKKIHETIRIENKDKVIQKYMKKLSEQFNIKTCWEAILGLTHNRRSSDLQTDENNVFN